MSSVFSGFKGWFAPRPTNNEKSTPSPPSPRQQPLYEQPPRQPSFHEQSSYEYQTNDSSADGSETNHSSPPEEAVYLPESETPFNQDHHAEDDEMFSSPFHQSRLGFDNSMNLVRRTVSGVQIPLSQMLEFTAHSKPETDMREAEFDAEEVGSESGSPYVENLEMTDGATSADESEEEYEETEMEEIEEEPRPSTEDVEMATAGEGSSAEQAVVIDDDEEDDLFAKLQRRPATQSSAGSADKETIDVDAGEGDTAGTARNKGKQHAVNVDEHTTGSKSRSASTPPPPQGSGPPPPALIDPVKDVRSTLKQQHRFHLKAKALTPRLPLAAHRYWICVLHIDKKPRNATSEKHFIWMKGNRFTTVQTIWHTYHTTALAEDFVLLLGHERLGFKDQCQELDYFNDKFICLRAVNKDEREAKGRELCESTLR